MQWRGPINRMQKPIKESGNTRRAKRIPQQRNNQRSDVERNKSKSYKQTKSEGQK